MIFFQDSKERTKLEFRDQRANKEYDKNKMNDRHNKDKEQRNHKIKLQKENILSPFNS